MVLIQKGTVPSPETVSFFFPRFQAKDNRHRTTGDLFGFPAWRAAVLRRLAERTLIRLSIRNRPQSPCRNEEQQQAQRPGSPYAIAAPVEKTACFWASKNHSVPEGERPYFLLTSLTARDRISEAIYRSCVFGIHKTQHLVQRPVNSCAIAFAICARSTPAKLAAGSSAPSLCGRTPDADIRQ